MLWIRIYYLHYTSAPPYWFTYWMWISFHADFFFGMRMWMIYVQPCQNERFFVGVMSNSIACQSIHATYMYLTTHFFLFGVGLMPLHECPLAINSPCHQVKLIKSLLQLPIFIFYFLGPARQNLNHSYKFRQNFLIFKYEFSIL